MSGNRKEQQMTHEVEQSSGEVADMWDRLGPAEAFSPRVLPDVPVASEKAPEGVPDPEIVEELARAQRTNRG